MLFLRRLPVIWVSACLMMVIGFAFAPDLCASEKQPEVSPEGLHLVKQTRSRLVYIRPGVFMMGSPSGDRMPPSS